MIDLGLPDKWIRQALFNALDGQVVDGDPIPVFDSLATVDPEPSKYILLQVQSNVSTELTFCGYEWTHSATLEVFTRSLDNGNPGSRLAVNNIVDMLLSQVQNLTLDPGSNLNIHRITASLPGGFYEKDDGYVVAASTVLLQFRIN